MAGLIWTEPPLSDLDAIAGYIALDDTSAAVRFVRQVFNRVERLATYPDSDRRVPELRDTPYREIIVKPCRIFYRLEEKTVYILYVMRSERLLRDYLLDLRNDER